MFNFKMNRPYSKIICRLFFPRVVYKHFLHLRYPQFEVPNKIEALIDQTRFINSLFYFDLKICLKVVNVCYATELKPLNNTSYSYYYFYNSNVYL